MNNFVSINDAIQFLTTTKEHGYDTIGIIGGTGLSKIKGIMPIMRVASDQFNNEPFGPPAGTITIGAYSHTIVIFMPRHGDFHEYSPSEVNYRGNVWAFKTLGADDVIGISAGGILSETDNIKPGHLIIPDQIHDETKVRPRSFTNCAVHFSLADPFCPRLRRKVISAIRHHGFDYHNGGTYVTIEGPEYSPKTTSRLYIQNGFTAIGMTTATELRLMRMAGICYVVIVMATDYDSGHKLFTRVDAKIIEAIMSTNQHKINQILPQIIYWTGNEDCSCHHAIDHGVHTDLQRIPVNERNIITALQKRR